MIIHGEVNPLNVLKAREIKYLPPHFSVIKLPVNSYNDIHTFRSKKIRNWIYKNLQGRFYVEDSTTRRFKGQEAKLFPSKIIVAFENSSELSFFNLACPEVTD